MREKPMKKPSIADRILDYLQNNPGRHSTADIVEAIDGSSRTSSVLGELARNGEIRKIKQGIYCGNDTGTASVSQQTLQRNISALREAEANGETINVLLNTYDLILLAYQSWVIKNIDEVIDFEKQLYFLENLKWLTAVVDKLMKRWALVHVGYDTNTRQAQEDAKLKTAEKEKAALEDAPIEEQVNVIGSFDLDTKQLIDAFPTLETLTDEEEEELKV